MSAGCEGAERHPDTKVSSTQPCKLHTRPLNMKAQMLLNFYLLLKMTFPLPCRWITPVLLIIDFYEKMAVSSKRREQMNKVNLSLLKIEVTVVNSIQHH